MFIKVAIFSGIVLSSILLVGGNGEQEVDITDPDANVFSESELKELDLISELKNEIIGSITEQLDSEPTSIMLSGNPFKEMTISVGFPKDVNVDDTLIQQIIEDAIKRVSERENVVISKENVTIKIEKY